MGSLYQENKQFRAQRFCYQQALKYHKKQGAIFNNMGVTYRERNNQKKEIGCLKQAVLLEPHNQYFLANLSNTDGFDLEGFQNSAIYKLSLANHYRSNKLYRKALTIYDEIICDEKITQYAIKVNKAQCLKQMGAFAEAKALCKSLLKAHPSDTGLYDILAGVVAACEPIEKALQAWELGAKYCTADNGLHHNRLFLYNYSSQIDPSTLQQAHLLWGQQFSAIKQPKFNHVDHDITINRKIKIGYVSGDFNQHSVGVFFAQILAHHDPEKFDIICYSQSEREDILTKELQFSANQWYWIRELDDETISQCIKQDGIDILIDLSGHTGGNRLGIFAYKPAPIQMSYLGYPHITGLPEIDYRLTDHWADPPELTLARNSEKPAYIQSGFLCYKPLKSAPSILLSGEPEDSARYTFACFNNLYKVTEEVIQTWCEILTALPRSNLLIKSHSFSGQQTWDYYREQFDQYGIDKERVHLMASLDTHDHLRVYNQVDIALDPFPYNGTTTSCDALWMGVPLLTLVGDRHASRVGVSILNQLNLADWIAKDKKEYVSKAIAFANSPSLIKHLRMTLRDNMKNSSLMDGARFTKNLEQVYQDRWAAYCKSNTKKQYPFKVKATNVY